MHLLSVSELNTALDEYFQRLIGGRFVQSWPYFHLLKVHGFRATEPAYVPNWTSPAANVYVCPTLKGGAQRVITEASISWMIDQCRSEGVNWIMTRGYDHYEEIFRAVNPCKRFFAGDKNCGTHVFRHAVMKTMYSNGASKEDIRVHFGLTNIDTVDKYLTQDIFAEVWPIP